MLLYSKLFFLSNKIKKNAPNKLEQTSLTWNMSEQVGTKKTFVPFVLYLKIKTECIFFVKSRINSNKTTVKTSQIYF